MNISNFDLNSSNANHNPLWMREGTLITPESQKTTVPFTPPLQPLSFLMDPFSFPFSLPTVSSQNPPTGMEDRNISILESGAFGEENLTFPLAVSPLSPFRDDPNRLEEMNGPSPEPQPLSFQIDPFSTPRATTPTALSQFPPSFEQPPENPSSGMQYRRISTLGKGTFGNVSLMTNTRTQTHSAVKAFADRNEGLRELKNYHYAGSCAHLVPIKNVIDDPARDFALVMPVLKTDPIENLSLEQTLLFAKTALEFLSHLHEKGLIHADLKPDNISFNAETSEFKFFDLGLAQAAHSIDKTQLVQSPLYRAPEIAYQSLGNDYELNYDSSIDIWSLGCILFEAFTGQQFLPLRKEDPYDGQILVDCIQSQLSTPVLNGPANWQVRLLQEGLKKPVSDYNQMHTFLTLMGEMLRNDPQERISARNALEKYFHPSI